MAGSRLFLFGFMTGSSGGLLVLFPLFFLLKGVAA